MRFLSSRCRTVAEVLLTVAVLAYVTYDLVDRSGGGKPSAEPASAPLPASSSSSPVSSLASSKAPGARFEALSPARSANDTIICGATPAAADPWPVLPNQVMIFVGTATPPCSSTPAVMGSNNLSYAGVAVKSGGWISLQNILASGSSIAGAVGRLTMDSGSYLEAIIPANFQGSPYIVQQLPLLKSTAACPSFVGVNNTVPRCISAPALASVGAYACFLTSTPDQTTCTISLTIVGAMSSQASNFITATLGWDCSAMTQATFKQTIELVVGIPAVAILVTYWQCASIVVYFTVLGGSVAQANVALNTIYISMSVGALRTALNVISVSIGSIATPAANLSYTTMTINYPYSYPYVLPYLVPYSTSNPGLLALLTLLLIPVGVALALLLWCACRPVKKPVPAPCPCPCPCPAPYMPLPTCMPAPCPPPVMCEPMCAPMACEPMCAPTLAPGAF